MGVREASRHLEKHSTLCYFDLHCRNYLADEQTAAEQDVIRSSEHLSEDAVGHGKGVGLGAYFALT